MKDNINETTMIGMLRDMDFMVRIQHGFCGDGL